MPLLPRIAVAGVQCFQLDTTALAWHKACIISPMQFSDSSETLNACQKIKAEIERLTREQTEALKAATFVGMTAEEARAHDERRQTITRLTQELRELKPAQ